MQSSRAAFTLTPSRVLLRPAEPRWPRKCTSTRRRTRRGLVCVQLGQSKVEKLITLSVNRGVERAIAERVLSGAQRAIRDWTGTVSEFLTPPESAALAYTVSNLADVRVATWGGYPDAERTALLCSHADLAESAEGVVDMLKEELVLLKVGGNFEFEKVSHRDFMGAILGAGVSRSKVGDIIVLDTRGAEVVVQADVAEWLQGALTSVRKVSVSVERQPLELIEIPPKRVKEVQSVEASMRLDAVVSAGLRMSRSKLADMVRSGLVSVNYKEAKGPAKNVKTGDVVSVRGVGKLEIGECETTSKGRYRIAMKRFI